MDIDLSKVIGYSKDSLKSRTLMRAIMKDLYPDKTREMNVLLDIYESGVPKEIRNNGTISSEQYQQYVEQIINNYGLQERFVYEGLDCWIDFCISPGTAAMVSKAEQQSGSNNSEAKIQEEIKHKLVNNTPINGDASDYEVTVLSTGKLEIKKFIGFDEKTIIVPNVIDGRKVIGIGVDAYRSCVGVERVNISEGIQYISEGAFSGCKKLKSIKLPSSILRIGNKEENNSSSRFYDGTYYNANCGGFNGYSPKGAFSETAIDKIDLPRGLTYLGKDTFYGCNMLTTINMPNSITEIGVRCFCKCTSLEKVQLPDRLNMIGEYAFDHCSKLNNLILPAVTKTIGRGAFSACMTLTDIRLNEGLTQIGDEAFQDCKSLTKIIIPSTVLNFGNNIFVFNGWYQPYDRRRNGYSTRSKNNSLIMYCYAGTKGLEYARKEGYQIENASKLNS